MTTLSIHPIGHLREHADHAHLTKRLLRPFMLIGCTLFFIGGFYNSVTNLNTAERDVVTDTYMNAFPAEMPDVVVESMIGFPAY